MHSASRHCGVQTTTSHRVTANIRAELARRGLNQGDIASVLRTTQASVSRRMLCRVPFDIEELDKIADLLGIDLEALIADHSRAIPA